MRAGPAAPPAPGAGGRTRLRRPVWTRLSRAHVVALLAALLAGGLNLAALRGADEGQAILAAAVDLSHGGALEERFVREVVLSGDPATLGGLVAADRLAERRGWLLTRPVRAGEPLRWSDLRDPDRLDGARAISVPLASEHAVGGSLRPGDRVDVIAVREGSALWVVANVEVLDVGDGEAADGLGAVPVYAVTLAVDESQALRLAWAMHDGAVELVRATGAPPLAQAGAVVRDGPAA